MMMLLLFSSATTAGFSSSRGSTLSLLRLAARPVPPPEDVEVPASLPKMLAASMSEVSTSAVSTASRFLRRMTWMRSSMTCVGTSRLSMTVPISVMSACVA